MLHSLLSAIMEELVSLAGGAVIKFLGLENIVELATAVIGLAFIVTGFFIWWLA